MRRGRPRLLFVVHAAERSGPPLLLLRFARWLDAGGLADLEFVLLEGGPIEHEFRRLGKVVVLDEFHPGLLVDIVESALHHLRAPGAAAATRQRGLRRRLAPVARPDLVFLNSVGTVRALRYIDVGDAPVVTQVHELSVGLDHWLADEDRDLVFSASDRLVAVSDAVAHELTSGQGVPAGSVSVHRGFVEADPTTRRASRRPWGDLGIPEGASVVGSCGTVDWRKGTDLFVRLAHEVHRADPGQDVHFVWVGGGATSHLRDLLRAELEGSAVDERVHFVGEQDDPLSWFAAMDVFVLPAREDAFPLVCLEAASVEVPVVCFDNGGAPELVERSGGGFVVPYPDVLQLADRVVTLLEDEALRRSMGTAARTGVEQEHTVAVAAPGLWAELEVLLP